MSGTDGHGTAGPGQQVRRPGRPGDDDHEVEQDRRQDRSRVGVAELLAELPRPRAPGDEREQRDRDRAPDERVAQESGHGSRCQTTASSVVVATDQPAGGPGSGTKPVIDWTVIGSIASMRSGTPGRQVDRGLDDREVGAEFGRRRQVDGRVAGVESEARAGRPGDRVRCQEPDLQVDRARSRDRDRQRGSRIERHGVPAVALHEPGRAGHAAGRCHQRRRLADEPDRRATPGEHDAIGAVAIGRRDEDGRVAAQGRRPDRSVARPGRDR